MSCALRCNLDPENVSGWCRHGFESHSLPFLLTFPRLINAEDFMSSVFIYDMATFTLFLCPFSVLAIALFIYYTSVSAGTEARTKVK